jgi:hypothetical protein
LHLVGIGWGLPSSDGWDNDGVAPRDFLAGIVETFWPGHFFRYPPLHLALLTVLTAPVSLVALVRARSLAAADVIAEIIRCPYMTVAALAARAVTMAMAGGAVWALAKTAEELRSRRAGVWTAAFAAACVPLVYYAHTSNLDVPYLFWACLALLTAVRAVSRGTPALLRRAGVFAALSVTTKDQAYGLFVLAVPVAIALWAAVEPGGSHRRKSIAVEGLRAVAVGVGTVAVVDGPLYNPQGFARRLAYLAGPASQPFAQYTDDWPGRLAALSDTVARFTFSYPLAFAAPVLLGAGLLMRDRGHHPSRRVAGVLPLLAAVSFTLTFNCVARRADPRFFLPQAAMLAIYGGVGVDALVSAGGSALARWAGRAAAAAAFGQAAVGAVAVDANLVMDPRYDAERWLETHVRAGDAIETYGLNVYLPRFPPTASVRRVGPEPLVGRSPLPGVEEVVAGYGEPPARAARFLVVPEAWAGRYLAQRLDPAVAGSPRAPPVVLSPADREAGAYFRALRRDGVGGYRLAHTARWQSRVWPRLDIHASTAREVWIYELADRAD